MFQVLFLVSRPTGRWDLRIRLCPSVRAYVRSRGTLFLGNRSLLFSETLHILRACKHQKNVPRAFLIIFTVLAILAKKWSKLAILDNCAMELINPFLTSTIFARRKLEFGHSNTSLPRRVTTSQIRTWSKPQTVTTILLLHTTSMSPPRSWTQ